MYNKSGHRIELFFLLLLSFTVLFVSVLPLDMQVHRLVRPDLLFCLFAAWVIRRPHTTPYFLIAVVALLADILMDRPIGLWALLILLSSEILRMSRGFLKDQMWLLEWLVIVGVFAGCILVQRLTLLINFLSVPPIEKELQYLAATAFAYPLVVAFLHWVLRIRQARSDGLVAPVSGGRV
jgi:rod shape-determining protein MreD